MRRGGRSSTKTCPRSRGTPPTCERRADEAERELVQWKKVRFMADKVGDEFDGFVTGVAAFGLFIELVEHFVEGLVHISSMADDYYRFLESTHTLRGENTHKIYRLGDRVRVQVVRVDLERRQIDLGLSDVLDASAQDERRRGPRRSKAKPKWEAAPKQRPGSASARRGRPRIARAPEVTRSRLTRVAHCTSSSAPPVTSITARAVWFLR